jgi:hypothetical protein
MLRTSDKRLFVGEGLRDILVGGSDYGRLLGRPWLSLVLADDPVVAYSFQEASGNPQDVSGNGNHITTIEDTPIYQQAGPGIVGPYSLRIEAGEKISRTIVSTLAQDMTCEFVLRRSASITNNHDWFANGTPASNGYGMAWDGTSGAIRLRQPGGLYAGSTTVIGTTDWVLFHLIRDGTQWEYWFNGIFEMNVTTASPGTPSGDLALGDSADDVDLDWAWFAQYDSVLSSSDMLARAALL